MSKEITKHTQTPWMAHDIGVHGWLLRSSDELQIGLLGRGLTSEEDEANAAHIVKCVNAHDALVAALLSFELHMRATYVDDYEPLVKARAALLVAGVEPIRDAGAADEGEVTK